MRVTGGQAKGHNLIVPQTVSDLRPSQDQVREAIFNILGDYVNDADVLDLYAGSGALGIEALSRGARTADFVDSSKDACDHILKNLHHSKLEGRSDVFQERVDIFLSQPHHQLYDLVFLDPPYADTPRNVILLVHHFIKPNGLLIYLHGKRIVLDNKDDREWIGKQLNVLDSRKYGQTSLSIMRYEPQEAKSS
ncbi:16S rRNA (guanine(966)-N(2))-methyltransferase RsmD [candidate division WWE3 bacterium]|uniref:16S rRNA (Guanine(966)-N(2))-methyltransferase RsmD n=1 Tax=candidate division WWE3 bacterium TaxID=2053526 RepID=A0A955LJM4_UNCKA|nr:16S rRNA (guanine(966)-N(2))-methyltransferase RsmD [candidate division WWE3 bacterium]